VISSPCSAWVVWAPRRAARQHARLRTVAIARGADKADTATELGAHHNINSTAGDVAKQLQALGGAKVVLATALTGIGTATAGSRGGAP
jgi:D-arabinose 1-dehydrogenase-like Zn-dependent alcohol dehydrogenase